MRSLLLALTVLLAGVAGACGPQGGAPEPPPPEPSAGTWRTWVVSPSAVRVPPPPAPGSPAAEGDAAELAELSEARAPDDTARARFWGQDPAVGPWLELSMDLVSARTKDPPAASRAYALLSVAMYDAAVAAAHWKSVYRRRPPGDEDALVAPGPDPSYPSEHAAIAGAASRVLAYAFPERPAARYDEAARDAASSRVMAGANFRSDVEAGLALGRAVGDGVVARARHDGFARKWDGTRPGGEGKWEPPPGSVARPVAPLAGTWRTWVLKSGSELRPDPPPGFRTAQFRAEAREVVAVKQKLTPEQMRIAKYWEGGEGTPLPPGVWNQEVLTQVGRARMSTPRAARALALVNVAMADAGVAAWDAKYAYWSPRPENAIRELGIDPRWKPYLATPFFPAYVSGHAVYSGAASQVLAHLFPAEADRFRARGEEAAVSRVLGGIHYRRDGEVGLPMGRGIGRRVVERASRDGAER